MMKRMLALLLAVLLLPAGALAEAIRLDVTVSMDADNAVEFFKAIGLFAGSSDEDKLCRTFAEFVDGVGLHVVKQEEAFTFDVTFDDTSLLDLAVMTGESEVLVASGLMNGSVLSIPLAWDSLQEDEFVRLMEQTDFASLLAGMLNAGIRHIDSLDAMTVRGSFTGDAYTGGVYCSTIHLDDADMADIVNVMLTEEFRALVMAVCDYWELDGAALLAQIDEKNAAVAQANEHRYVVRLVYDAFDTPVGISAVAFRGDEQLGTFSFGMSLESENALVVKYVVGFGLEDMNYWHSHEIRMARQDVGEDNHTYSFSGMLREFTAPKSDDFSYAAATVSDFRMNSDWQLALNREDGNYSWEYSVAERMGSDAPLMKAEGKGMYMPGKSLVNSVTSSMDGKAYMTEELICEPCDPIDLDMSAMNVIDMTANEDALEELGMTIGFGLVERLMKVIPMELLLFMQ